MIFLIVYYFCRKLKNLEAQLERLKKIDQDYDRKIQIRRSQFHLFLVALKELQDIIESKLCLNR